MNVCHDRKPWPVKDVGNTSGSHSMEGFLGLTTVVIDFVQGFKAPGLDLDEVSMGL